MPRTVHIAMHKAILKDSRIDISIVIPIGIDVSIPVASDTSPNVQHTRMSLPLVVRIVIYVAIFLLDVFPYTSYEYI